MPNAKTFSSPFKISFLAKASRLMFFSLFLFSLLSIYTHNIPSSALAATGDQCSQSADTLCLLCPEACGKTSGKNISSGEFFKCELTGANTFKICKSQGCSQFEEFAYDGSYIKHAKEQPWAGSNGAIRCEGTGQETYNRRFVSNTDRSPMLWLPRHMNVGDCFNQQGEVVGFVLGSNDQECPRNSHFPIGATMCLEYAGCTKFPTGVTSSCAYNFHITGGAGAGENFYYDHEAGWIGFNFGTGGGNYINEELDPPSPLACRLVTGGTTKYDAPNFTPKREITTSQTSKNVSDFVDLHDSSGPLAIGEDPGATFNFGGHYSFRDQTIPFAQELTKFLAGPYAYQGQAKIQEAIDSGNLLNSRPPVLLTNFDYQDQLKLDYYNKCKNGLYKSNPPEENECGIADGSKIQDITPPPTKPASTTSSEYKDYLIKIDAWLKSPNLKKWAQVPLVSNPITVVQKATTVQGCRIEDGKTTTSVPSVSTIVETKTPWISALNDVSQILSNILVPRPSNNTSASNNKGQLFTSADPASLPTDSSTIALAQGEALVKEGNFQNNVLAASNCNASTAPPVLYFNKLQVAGNTIDWEFCTGVRGASPACGIRDFQVIISASTGDSTGFMPGGGSRLTVGQCFKPNDGGTHALSFPSGATTVSVTGFIRGERDPGSCIACPKELAITCTLDIATGASSCGNTPPPPPDTTCKLPLLPNDSLNGADDAIQQQGHAASFAGANIGCETFGGTTCAKEGRAKVTARMWAETQYPFLDQVYENLTGHYGALGVFSTTDLKWSRPGQSPITYNFCDSTSLYSGYITEVGKDLPTKLSDADKAKYGYGGCGNDVTVVGSTKTYPNYIGGAKEGKDYVQAITGQ